MSTFVRYNGSAFDNGSGGGGGGVSSLNTLTGAIVLLAGTGITLTPAGNNITIDSSGGGANQALSNLTSPTSINQNLTIQPGITLNNSSDVPKIDLDNGTIGNPTGTVIDFNGGSLMDGANGPGTRSVGWVGRQLFSAEDTLRVDWENVVIADDFGVSINWGGRLLVDTTGSTVANYNSPTPTPQFTVAQLGVQNSAPATLPGTVVNKIEVFDGSGTSLGFIAVYNTIT